MRITLQLAIVIGVGKVADPPLENAARDAESLGRLLRKDFDFELLPKGKPLLEEHARRDTIRRCVEESLRDGTSATRWLFYFAGHGTVIGDQGFLVPAGVNTHDSEQLLSLRWLVEQALKSRCGEVLIVLDACHAGRALLRPEVDPWLNPDAPEDLGTVQVLAASGPHQKVVDGYGEGHSVFTQCLLEALDGRAGIHDVDGAVRFTPLKEHLAVEVERRLREARVPDRQQLFGVPVRLGSAGHLQGEFRFQPRWPRLPKKLVQGLRHTDPRVRRDSLAQLEGACRKQPQRLSWNLSLAIRLALQGLPRGSIKDAMGSDTPPSYEPRWEVRQQQARTLGKLDQLERTVRTASEIVRGLLHLALWDADAAVRHEARRSLTRVRNMSRQRAMGRCLERLRCKATRLERRRLRQILAVLPGYCGSLTTTRRGGAYLTRGALAFGVGWRWIVRHRLRRWGAISVTGLYLVLGTSYYIGPGPNSEVVVRCGLPGFEALLFGIDATAVVTDFNVRQLKNGAVVTEEDLIGTWLLPSDGAFGWGRQLAAHLRPQEAIFAWWRLGDLDRALEASQQGIAAADSGSVRAAAYLAFQSEDAFEPVVQQLLAALDAEGNNVRDEAVQALEVLHQARPEGTATTLGRLVDRLGVASEDEQLALIEAISILGNGASAAVAFALETALERLERQPEARVGRRLEMAVERLLEAHPELSIEHRDDLMRLTLERTESRSVLLEAAAGSAVDAEEGRRTATALHRLLRSPGEPGRLAALGLLQRLLDDDPSLINGSASVLESLSRDPDPEVVLAAARVVAALPAGPRSSFHDRLTEFIRRTGSPKLRFSAAAQIAKLSDGRLPSDVVQALLAAAEDDDAEVRGQAVPVLVDLALTERIDPAELEGALGTALRDRSPWVRAQAAEGILLLADHLDAHVDLAFAQAMAEIRSPQRDWQAAEKWGRIYTRTTPRAAASFGDRLLLELLTGKGDTHVLLRCFELLAHSQPAALPELTPTLTLLLAGPRDEIAQQVSWRLSTLQRDGLDLTPLSERFLAQLRSPSGTDRRAAAFVLGTLTAPSSKMTGRVLAALEDALEDPDPEVVARIPDSLQIMVWKGDVIAEVTALLLRGLADPHPEVQRSFARALARTADSEPPSVPVPLPAVVRSAVEGAPTEVRRHAVAALALWARQLRGELAGELVWLQGQFAKQEDPIVRLRLASAWGIIASDSSEAVEELTLLVKSALASGEEHQQSTAILALANLAQARPAHSRQVARTLRDALPMLESPLDQLVLSKLRDLGTAHTSGSEAALDALASILAEEEDDQLRWSVIVNGLGPLVKSQPERAPEIRKVLERFLLAESSREDRRDRPPYQREQLLSRAWEVWVAATVESASENPGLLWWGMLSAYPSGRHAALQVLARLVSERPELIPKLQKDLERRRRSIFPHLRMEVAEALEMIEILQSTREHLEDPEAFERWQDVLGWLSNMHLQVNIDQAVNRMRERRLARNPTPIAASPGSDGS